ncbi:MAG TPA: hypothetical protein VM658_21305 [bacterium]|nr:hypothetical protein [bacterium]
MTTDDIAKMTWDDFHKRKKGGIGTPETLATWNLIEATIKSTIEINQSVSALKESVDKSIASNEVLSKKIICLNWILVVLTLVIAADAAFSIASYFKWI